MDTSSLRGCLSPAGEIERLVKLRKKKLVAFCGLLPPQSVVSVSREYYFPPFYLLDFMSTASKKRKDSKRKA